MGLALPSKKIPMRRAQSLVRSAGIDNTPLFDDLVGAGEQHWGHVEAYRLGGL